MRAGLRNPSGLEGQHRGRARIRQAARAGAHLSGAPAIGLRRADRHDLHRSRQERDHRSAPPVSLTGMLAGVVPFPLEFAQRYREKNYWRDKSLAEEFGAVFARFADRVAVVDRGRSYTYAEVDRAAERLASDLLDAALEPLR